MSPTPARRPCPRGPRLRLPSPAVLADGSCSCSLPWRRWSPPSSSPWSSRRAEARKRLRQILPRRLRQPAEPAPPPSETQPASPAETPSTPPTTPTSPPSIEAGTLPRGAVGSPYDATLTASGGTEPYTWSLTSGALPAGLSLGEDGVVSGTPTAEETADFTAEVADADGQTATQSFSIAVVYEFTEEQRLLRSQARVDLRRTCVPLDAGSVPGRAVVGISCGEGGPVRATYFLFPSGETMSAYYGGLRPAGIERDSGTCGLGQPDRRERVPEGRQRARAHALPRGRRAPAHRLDERRVERRVDRAPHGHEVDRPPRDVVGGSGVRAGRRSRRRHRLLAGASTGGSSRRQHRRQQQRRQQQRWQHRRQHRAAAGPSCSARRARGPSRTRSERSRCRSRRAPRCSRHPRERGADAGARSARGRACRARRR